MPKIAFIGAGSWGFTRKLVRDVLTFPLLENSTIALMDIDAEQLGLCQAGRPTDCRDGQIPCQSRSHDGTSRGAQGRRLRRGHDSGRRAGRVAA